MVTPPNLTLEYRNYLTSRTNLEPGSGFYAENKLDRLIPVGSILAYE